MGNIQFRTLLFALLCGFLSGCQSIPQALDPEKTFKQDLIVNINGVAAEGVAVVPQASTYAIAIESRGKIDLLVFKTCNREVEVKGQKKEGVFGRNRKVEYNFVPNERERESGCPLEMFALAESGKNSFALIVFQTPKYSLPITIECNGETKQFVGVSVCQSRAGLQQQVKFPGEVVMGSIKRECELPPFAAPGLLVFPLKPAFCNYIFTERAKPHRTHRLYAVGYEDFIVKGEQ